ncbi:MAG: hypothetical protein QM617_12670, partial [Comamonas sp.]
MSAPSRYAVGIDLGTSHTVAAWARLDDATGAVAVLPLPQRVSAAEVAARPLLPSVRYQAAPGELGAAWELPWPAPGASAEAAPTPCPVRRARPGSAPKAAAAA